MMYSNSNWQYGMVKVGSDDPMIVNTPRHSCTEMIVNQTAIPSPLDGDKKDKVLGWKLYECLKNYYKYHLPLDEPVEYDLVKLMDEVYDYFNLGDEEG